jgi:hypothetical protein
MVNGMYVYRMFGIKIQNGRASVQGGKYLGREQYAIFGNNTITPLSLPVLPICTSEFTVIQINLAPAGFFIVWRKYDLYHWHYCHQRKYPYRYGNKLHCSWLTHS